MCFSFFNYKERIKFFIIYYFYIEIVGISKKGIDIFFKYRICDSNVW